MARRIGHYANNPAVYNRKCWQLCGRVNLYTLWTTGNLMAQKSYYWDGLVTGDASLAPYSQDVWNRLWQVMFSRADNEGVLDNIDDELAVSGTTVAVSVATGKALVDGSLYQSDGLVNIAIPTPVTDPRIDRIVVRKDWSTQTIRVARVPGTENASPTAPALTQIDLSVWEIPLAQALITTGGIITVTDERENARTRLALASAGISVIETFTSNGGEAQVDFSSIPSTFRHLVLRGSILSSVGGLDNASIRLNGDASIANYNRQVFGRAAGGAVAGAQAGALLPPINTLGSERLDAQHNTQFDIRIPNYKDTTFYKIATQKESVNINNTAADLDITIETFLWKNTDAVNRITIVPASGGTIEPGSVITLFGID